MLKKILYSLCLLCLPLYAQEKPTLTIATYDSFSAEWGLGPIVKKNFEPLCKCHITFVEYSSSLALISALKSNQLQNIDILLGFDHITYKNHSFIKDYLSPHMIKSLPYDHDEFTVAYDYGTISLVTHDTNNGVHHYTSWDHIISSAPDHSIVLIDPRSSTVGQAMLLDMALAYGPELGTFLQNLKPKILTITQGWSSAYALFTEKEANMVLSYTTSPSYHRLIEKDQSKVAVLNKAGHIQQIELMAILQQSQQKENAQKFLRYMVSDDVQKLIPLTQWMFPIVPTTSLPENFITHTQPKLYNLDAININQTLQDALKVYEQYF